MNFEKLDLISKVDSPSPPSIRVILSILAYLQEAEDAVLSKKLIFI